MNARNLVIGGSADREWLELLQAFEDIEPTVSPRQMLTKEFLGRRTVIDMMAPIVSNPIRNVSYRFMAAEAAWIMSGDNRVRTITPYSKKIANFSDDGVTFFGAYGPPIRDQMRHVVASLLKDQDSRQAVISIWRPNPPMTKDTPCTCLLQFMIREGMLHCLAYLRSSDMWLGIPYDWFNFSMLSAMVALRLRDKGLEYRLGNLYFYAASQHMYEAQFHKYKDIEAQFHKYKDIEDQFHKYRDIEDLGTYQTPTFDYTDFEDEDDLISHLWSIADMDLDGLSHYFMVNQARERHGKITQ